MTYLLDKAPLIIFIISSIKTAIESDNLELYWRLFKVLFSLTFAGAL